MQRCLFNRSVLRMTDNSSIVCSSLSHNQIIGSLPEWSNLTKLVHVWVTFSQFLEWEAITPLQEDKESLITDILVVDTCTRTILLDLFQIGPIWWNWKPCETFQPFWRWPSGRGLCGEMIDHSSIKCRYLHTNHINGTIPEWSNLNLLARMYVLSGKWRCFPYCGLAKEEITHEWPQLLVKQRDHWYSSSMA